MFLLRELLDRKAEGWLRLVDDHGQRHEIALDAGMPCALNSELAIEPFERSLVRLGLLTRAQLRRLGMANVSEEEAALHLVEQGVLDASTLRRAKQYRLLLRLERLYSLGPTTRYTIRRGVEIPAGAAACNTVALLMRGFRRFGRSERAAEVLSYLGDEPLVLRRDADLRRLGLTRIERAVVDRLEEGATALAELEVLGPRPVVRTAVYALAELRFLEVARDQTEPVAAEVSPAALERARERALVAAPIYTRTQLRERLRTMDRQTYFDVLGVSMDASFEQVRAAHLGLLYIWHPDRLPPSLMDARDEVVEICSRLAEACRVLTDHDRRASYVAALRARDTKLASLADSAPALLARAEAAFRAQRYDEAEALLVRLSALDRDHLQARALLAWLKAQRIPRPKLIPGHKSSVYAHPLAMLDEVIRCDPSLERARYWRGALLKRAGFVHEAYAEFRAVLRLNPHNLGAVREVRAFEMRRRKRTER